MIEYNPHDWKSHLFDIRGSLAREIFFRVLACTAFSVFVVAFHKLVYPIATSLEAHTLIGFALSLLLIFRTNASYDRYWEGRRLWGSIINECRNLVRAARAYLAEDHGLLEDVGLWTTAFAYSTMHGLRDAAGLGPPFDRLPREEVTVTLEARNVPLAVAARISEKLAEARTRGLISDYARVELDRIVKELVDYLGGCERILRTPLPFVYMVHLRRALILYCFTLPFPLVKSYHWFTIVIVLLLSYILFGIEEIGVEIENPFGDDSNDLSLEQYCGRIERDVAELLALPLRPSLPVSDGDPARPTGQIHG